MFRPPYSHLLHQKNIMFLLRWTSLLLRLFLHPPLILRPVKVWILVTRWLRRRRRRQRRRSLINERLMLQLLHLRNCPLQNRSNFHERSNSLACSAKVTTFFETVLALPRYLKYGSTAIRHCLWLLEVMKLTHLRLVLIRLVRKSARSRIPVSSVKGIIPFTFVGTWMKPRECWTTLLFHHLAFRLVTIKFL